MSRFPLTDRIRAVREAGAVERCHVIPHIRPYDNARHTYGVCCLLRLLWPESPQLVDFALFHDTPERWTGDVPGQVIRNNPDLGAVLKERDREITNLFKLPCEFDLNEIDFARFKACDRLDFWLWTFDEEAFGNRHVLNSRGEIERHIFNDPRTPQEVINLMNDFRVEGWRRLPETL
ncbi:hypothetical protein EVC26_011 [Rhizobium phage RHph_I72]|nr:hypothetical protein EVC13_011 [Rhizobium phage RHph_I65]QIG76457.1 hypothetical protein EVC26_011 [Rhizobium phage RHph_I72]